MATIRLSGPADVAALADIWRRSVRATHGFLSERDFVAIERIVQQDYLPQAPLWVFLADGRPAGFMGLSGSHVDALFVDPALRGKGIGRAMLAHAAAIAGALSVDVNEQNAPAVAFYERMGFRCVGRSPLDDAGRPYPLLHMRQQ
ncbi:acetyltransferase [Massilia niastensis]|uniref:acetyltransferase n=1 Tax=Massilia niastensis TaxID=544911 RepID=UPI00037435C9|nr:acetyltransferase [Massilia niastensis]